MGLWGARFMRGNFLKKNKQKKKKKSKQTNKNIKGEYTCVAGNGIVDWS